MMISSLLLCMLLSVHLNSAKQDVMIKSIRIGCDKVPSHSIETRLSNCKTRLDIDLKITGVKQVNSDTQYIAVERVFDDALQKEVRLLTPVLIKLWQENVTLVYPLQTVAEVNNKAYEVIIHKDNVDNFTGCVDDTPQQATCGHHFQDGKAISHGFCCQCDKSFDNQPYHARGGQDCSKECVAKTMNSPDYLSSAHCLRFDPVWYSIKDLQSPHLQHSVYANVFVEEIDQSGKRSWVDMTGKVDIGVSTQKTSHLSHNNKVLASYVEHGNQHPTGPLNIYQQQLLVPQTSLSSTRDTHLQMMGDSNEFLVLDRDDISVSGNVCDKVGVSYEAFTSQLYRCKKAAQSCLDKQPMYYWLHDIEKKLQKKKGNYFLGNIAEPAEPSLVQHVDMEKEWLRLKYTEKYHAHLYLQINADHILILPRGLNVSIDEVRFSSNTSGDSLSVYVHNSGLLSASFSVLLDGCNNSRIFEMRTRLAVVGPRKSASFDLEFGHVTPRQSHIAVACHVNVLNKDNKTVADRHILFRLGEQCFCMGQCECSCTSSLDTRCSPSPEMGITYHKVHGLFTSLSDYRFIICCILILMLIIGLLKAIFGLMAPVTIGQKVISWFIEKKPLEMYYEKSLKHRTVIYNEKGVAVHPETNKPVQEFPSWQMFLINLFFCFCLPFVWICWLWRKRRRKEVTEFTPLQKWDSFEKLSTDQTNSDLQTGGVFSKQYSLTEIERREAISQYKKQKQDLTKFQQLDSLSPKRMATHEISPENHEVKKDKNVRRFFIKDSVHQLLKKELVYFNFTETSEFLKRSGNKYSMCGKLVTEGRRYRFHLNGYEKQTHENDNGIPKKIEKPKRIIHPNIFSQLLTVSGVYECVSEQPEYPCLN